MIVVYVVPIILAAGAIVIGVFALIGSCIGIVKSIKNFVLAIKELSGRPKSIRKYKNDYAIAAVHDRNTYSYSMGGFDPSFVDRSSVKYKAIPRDYCFEDIAARSYFLGPCFKDVFSIIREALAENYNDLPEFGRGDHWYSRVLFFILSLFQLVVTVVLGTVFTLAISAILLSVFLVIELVVLSVSGIALSFENLFYLSRRISYRCPMCKEEYNIAIYKCPCCGIPHSRLRPGAYGIFRRKCICGALLPLTARGKGYIDPATASSGIGSVSGKYKLTDMKSFCPHCGAGYNAGLSKPTSIALIGGSSAGKTTFKVAFSYLFLDEETVKSGMDVSFPDKQSEDEYQHSVRYFKGLDIIPGTNRGVVTDITTFSFALEHAKFDASRMIQIYDMPGEVFSTGEAREGWKNYRFTEGMVFLIDPFSLPTIKRECEEEIKASSMGICQTDMGKMVESLIDTLQNEKVKKVRNKFSIPVALTINKVDSPLLRKLCGPEAVAILMKELPDIFDDYFDTIDYVCRCFLEKNGCIGFISNLDSNFETIHFFFSSPMGYIPQASRVRFRPVNVLPVMQWMMLRADSQLARAWKPELKLTDIPEEKRRLYQTHPEYYEIYVLGAVAREEVKNG